MNSTERKNVILVDFNAPKDWEFLDAIEKSSSEKWNVKKYVSNRNHGNVLQKLIRYTKYFITPFDVFLHRVEYSQVLGWQQFYGLILAFYCRLFRVKNVPLITVMTFIYKPKSSLIGRGYEKFVRYCVTSNCINKIIVHSEAEREYYAEYFAIQIEKFVCVKLGIEDKTREIPIRESKGYYLAAGRSNRDYSFLLSVWDNKLPLKVVCDSLDCSSKENVEILKNCYGNEYLRLLSECHAVIIPLENVHVSSGQLVILQAMMYGKPVIVTENDTVRDYFVHGEDGYIISKNQYSLKDAIEWVEQNYSKLSEFSRKHYEDKFSLFNEGLTIGEILKRR